MTASGADLPRFARFDLNLASAGLGALAISATDEFFAPLERMLQDSDPVFIPDKYDHHGKWMDGWETRRRRDGGNDHAIIELATCGRITGFDVNTAHFTGNFAPACRIEAAHIEGYPDEHTTWVEILPTQQLGPDAHHFFACDDPDLWTHLRIQIYPDGGIARLRVYGEPHLDPNRFEKEELDLAGVLNGGRIVAFSDAHYCAYHRMLAPGRGENMGDGWETRRRREPGYDWIVVALGARGRIERAVIDTAWFKGNFPDSCSLQAADLSHFKGDLTAAIVTSAMFWPTLLEEKKLTGDAEHVFEGADIADLGPVTHVRLNIHPDGGISRLRLFGRVE